MLTFSCKSISISIIKYCFSIIIKVSVLVLVSKKSIQPYHAHICFLYIRGSCPAFYLEPMPLML